MPVQLRISDIPPETREQLRSQGIDLEGVLFQAQQMGLNLENPQSAALRARQLGILESRIREMLRVREELQQIQAETSAGGAAISVRHLSRRVHILDLCNGVIFRQEYPFHFQVDFGDTV